MSQVHLVNCDICGKINTDKNPISNMEYAFWDDEGEFLNAEDMDLCYECYKKYIKGLKK